jgi:hypothetical protein
MVFEAKVVARVEYPLLSPLTSKPASRGRINRAFQIARSEVFYSYHHRILAAKRGLLNLFSSAGSSDLHFATEQIGGEGAVSTSKFPSIQANALK